MNADQYIESLWDHMLADQQGSKNTHSRINHSIPKPAEYINPLIFYNIISNGLNFGFIFFSYFSFLFPVQFSYKHHFEN